MRKIGILTFWGVPNYGAFAQAYALNNTVKSLCPEDEVVHINYLHPAHWDSYYKTDERLYQSFHYSYNKIPHTEKMNADELEDTYFDCIITGSDAIWEFSIDVFGKDGYLIGNHLKCGKLIAYAPSFGTMNKEEQFDSYVREGLLKYENSISVRDDNSAEIVKKIIGKSVPVVCDPVLNWDFKKDQNIEQTAYANYILVYGIDFSQETIDEVTDYAKRKHLRIISIGYTNSWCDINIRMLELRCLEWIGMFDKAECVCTNTFHGLQFSLIYNKKVYFELVPYVINRATPLLKKLGLYECVQNKNNMDEIMDKDWDYDKINMILKDFSKKSIEFLNKELH